MNSGLMAGPFALCEINVVYVGKIRGGGQEAICLTSVGFYIGKHAQ